VQNGGSGLGNTAGVVSTQADDYKIRGGTSGAEDYWIDLTVPASDQYLNIRWQAVPWDVFHTDTFLKAKLAISGAGKYIIGIDYNGVGNVATTNLYDVTVTSGDYNEDWYNAYDNAGNT